MNQATGSPGWYLHRDGETAGPYDDGKIVSWIRGGMTDGMIRWGAADPASPWLPLNSHAPFAQALAQGSTPQPTKAGLSAKEVAVLLGVGVLVIIGYSAFTLRDGGTSSGSSSASQLVQGTRDPACSRMSDQYMDLSKRGILSDDELKKPLSKALHFTAVQLRQMPEDFMNECRAWAPEVKKCSEQARTVMDYELCKRSDGEYVPGAAPPPKHRYRLTVRLPGGPSVEKIVEASDRS